ncbi:hypothetical protein OS493_019031 [Desmophyllum pertusum]|uniref:Uncharacterized protein n=1 Tax=Desmophyllum pertusum TaxID=174260 RepID=A0A9X0CQP5_9CNID|nr:hypothetical protein OS493_019031 [Desmophyllum pertusum]
MSIYSSTRALDSEMAELGEISRYRLQDQTLSTENNECCCFKKYKFRVWQILLIVFIVLVMIALLCLIIAMFGPGNTDLKYSAVVATDVPGVVNGGEDTKAPTEEPTTASGEETTPAVTTATTEQQPSPKPTTAPETTVKQTTPQTTGQTSAGPSTVSPASTSPPSTTAEQTTTAAPTTTGPAPTTTAPSLECGVAIVGAGISGLLLAHTLLQSKKKQASVFLREKIVLVEKSSIIVLPKRLTLQLDLGSGSIKATVIMNRTYDIICIRITGLIPGPQNTVVLKLVVCL